MSKKTLKLILLLCGIITLAITSFFSSDVIAGKLSISLGIIACICIIKNLQPNKQEYEKK